jgi:hypothetical protein
MFGSFKKVSLILVLSMITAQGVFAANVRPYPAHLRGLSAEQLEAYYNTQKAKKSLSLASLKKTSATNLAKDGGEGEGTAEEEVAWGKEQLRLQNFRQSLTHFNAAIGLDPTNQKAYFWKTIGVLGSNTAILQKLKDLKILDANGHYMLDKAIDLPEVISLREYQELDAKMADQVAAARNVLRNVNQTFTDVVTDKDLGSPNIMGTLQLDYAAAQALNMALNQLEMGLRLANSFDTDFAQLTANDFGKVTKENLRRVLGVTNVDTIYADLIRLDYIKPSGKINRAPVLQAMAGAIVSNRNGSTGTYVFYSWIGDWGRRALLGQADSCGTYKVYTGEGDNARLVTTVTTTLDANLGVCKSPAIVLNDSDYPRSALLSMTYKGKTYESMPYIWTSSTEGGFLNYFPIDTILAHPKSEAILKLLQDIRIQADSNPIALMEFYPRLLAIKATSQEQLNLAKTCFIDFIDSYMAMSEFLRKRDDVEGVNYAIRMYKEKDGKSHVDPLEYQKGKVAHTPDEAAARELLTNIKNNLTNPGAHPFVVVPNAKIFENNPYSGLKINLAAVFTARDLRTYIQYLHEHFNKYKMIASGFPDPSLGGVFVGATGADLNFVFGRGAPELESVFYYTPNRTATISWGSLDTTFVQSLKVVRTNGNSVVTFNVDKNARTYLDVSLDPTVLVYTYKLEVEYRFNDNRTARAYSNSVKLDLTPQRNSAPVIFNVGPQTVQEGSPLRLTIRATDPDFEVVNLTATSNPNVTFKWNVVFEKENNAWVGNFEWPSATYINNGQLTLNFAANDGKATTVLNVPVTIQKAAGFSLKGVVIDNVTRKPIQKANVRIIGMNYSSSDKSDPTFEFNDIPAGTYKVTVSKPGYVISNQVVVFSKPLSKKDFKAASKSLIVSLKRSTLWKR